MTGPHRIPDEVCAAAIDLVLLPLGTALRHYMPVHKTQAIEAMRGVLLAQRDQDVERAREEIGRVTNFFCAGETA